MKQNDDNRRRGYDDERRSGQSRGNHYEGKSRAYGGGDEGKSRSYGRNDEGRSRAYEKYDEGKSRAYGGNTGDARGRSDDRRSGSRGEGYRGPGRRTYDEGTSGPRVGRVAQDVPRAERVTGDKPSRSPRRDDFERRPHHGAAYRAPSGPREYARRDAERDYEAPEYEAMDYEAPEIPEDLAAEFTDVPMDEHMLVGRNPIREALKAGRPMEKLLVAAGDLSGSGREIIRMAKDAGVVVQQVSRARLDQIYPAHQGMLAYVAAVPYTALEDILSAARAKGEDPFLILLDGVTDPHNLGAIIRSAECAGAHGVVIPERRSAGLSPVVAKAAAGALNHMPVARVSNLNRAIDALKAEGVWIIGTAMNGEDALSADLTGPVALVIGSEGDGVSHLTLQKCDRTLSLPMKGHIESLNASVAAGILMYEVLRARTKG